MDQYNKIQEAVEAAFKKQNDQNRHGADTVTASHCDNARGQLLKSFSRVESAVADLSTEVHDSHATTAQLRCDVQQHLGEHAGRAGQIVSRRQRIGTAVGVAGLAVALVGGIVAWAI